MGCAASCIRPTATEGYEISRVPSKRGTNTDGAHYQGDNATDRCDLHGDDNTRRQDSAQTHQDDKPDARADRRQLDNGQSEIESKRLDLFAEDKRREQQNKPRFVRSNASQAPSATIARKAQYTHTPAELFVQLFDFRNVNPDDGAINSRPSVAAGELWRDSEFDLQDAFTDSSTSSKLAWKRVSEISSNPQLFTDGTTRYDIGQGGPGTCWFLSIVASIADRPELLNKIIPGDGYPFNSSSYDGVFHAKFWRFGKWEDVYVDDYLPVLRDFDWPRLWGARSAADQNEFWVSLLEKAFARHHGSYNAVYGGWAGDAYLALTGGVAEVIDFDFENNDSKPRKIFNRICNAINSGALVTCSVAKEHDSVKGLVGAHAYTLTGTAQTSGYESLIRVRNPWGHVEWTGAWSDGSKEWTGVSPEEVPRAVIDDGEFWICLDDFNTYFSQITICSITPDFDMDGRSDSLNYMTNVYGEWQGHTAAGFNDKLLNPRFLFTVPKSESEAAVVVQLIQKTKNRQTDNTAVRCDLYKVLGDNGTSAVLEIRGDNTNKYNAEVQCVFRHKLESGTYALVPSTSEAGQENCFLIRIFSPCPLSNIREPPREQRLMSITQEASFAYNGEEYHLNFCHLVLGAWRKGINAGGQISHQKTHQTNPQFVISVTEPTSVSLTVVQDQCNPPLPIGLQMFPTGNAPLSIAEIYSLYDQAVIDIEGARSKFIQAWDVKACYMLYPGWYTLLLFLDEPNTEKHFALVVKSTVPVNISGHQTGNITG